MSAEVVYLGPLLAPLAKGAEVAELVVHVPDLPDRRIKLITEAEVDKAGFLKRFLTAADTLYGRYVGSPAS